MLLIIPLQLNKISAHGAETKNSIHKRVILFMRQHLSSMTHSLIRLATVTSEVETVADLSSTLIGLSASFIGSF